MRFLVVPVPGISTFPHKGLVPRPLFLSGPVFVDLPLTAGLSDFHAP